MASKQLANSTQKEPLSLDLEENRKRLENVFVHCSDLAFLPWQYGPELKHTAFSAYFRTLVQKKELNYMKASLQDLVTHEIGPATMVTPNEIINFFTNNGVSAESAMVIDDFNQAVLKLLNGNIVIFFEGWNQTLCYQAIGLETRQVSDPPNESAVQGPREGTVEFLDKNIGMIRLRIRSPHLKIELFTVGLECNTQAMFGYLDNAVNPDTLIEFKKRIADIDPDLEILDPGYIEALIEDSTYSPFPQYRYTERTDTAAGALLEGKIIVMLQGSPSILICPGLLVEFFMTSEDYYQRTVHSSLIRILRLTAFFLAIYLPSIYIAFSTFHPELLPTVLLLAILDTREAIPFPAFIEALMMEFSLELLREAGVRLPKPIGSAVSIVGALVIGQAAIQAHIASPVMVIVVAVTAIASFSLPQYNLGISLRIMRFPFMLLASTLGGFGLMIGLLLTYLHLSCLRSLGQPYLSSLSPFKLRDFRDIIIRIPLKKMLRFPRNHLDHKPTGRNNL